MKTFNLQYQRIENCEIEITAKNKKEARNKFSNQDYDLEQERIDEIFHKLKSVEEIK
jgi:hypothetical protein